MKKILLLLLIIFFISIYFFYSNNVSNLVNNGNFLDIEKIKYSKNLAIEGLINNFNKKNYFQYLYDPLNDKFHTNNNEIRQLIASRILACESQNNEKLLQLHQKNLSYIIDNLYKQDGKLGYILYSNKAKLGATAMFLRTLVCSPYFDDYKDISEKLINTINYLTNTDGGFENAFLFYPDNYEYDNDYLLTFYSGEATTSLAEYYLKTGNEQVLKNLITIQDYYIDHYVDNIHLNYYPAYVPWHTISMNILFKLTKNKKYSKAIYVLNDKLLELQDQKDGIHKGRFYNPDTPQYGQPHSSSDGVYTEGLLYAFEVSLLENNNEYILKYKKAIKYAFDNLLSLQYNDFNIDNYKNKIKVKGSFRINTNDPKIRVDTTGHAIDALNKALELINK